MMFCRLCLNICENGELLYNVIPQETETYRLVFKFFGEHLSKDTNCTEEQRNKYGIICTICWAQIREFEHFRAGIAVAQQQYEVLIQLEEIVKEETDIIEFPQETLTRPIKQEVLDETSLPLDVHSAETPTSFEASNQYDDDDDDDDDEQFHWESQTSSDDAKPLLHRLYESREVKRNNKQLKRTTARLLDRSESKKCHQRNAKTKEADAFIQAHKPLLECSLCNVNSTSFTQLHVHFREQHTGQRPFVTCCHKKYFHRFHFVEHLRVHLNAEHFKCSVCGKCSANSRSLATHMKVIHSISREDRRFECEICHKRFSTAPILRSHMETHTEAEGDKNFKCAECGKGFVLENRLNIHIRTTHSRACVCELCGRTLKNPYILKYHLLQHNVEGKPKFNCEICGTVLASKFGLKRHIESIHNDGSMTYECTECGKVSANANALRSHKKYVHERQRNYKCTICVKAFKSNDALKDHMSTHTGLDLYKCPHCERTFKSRANMHHHRKRKHHKEWAENLRVQYR